MAKVKFKWHPGAAEELIFSSEVKEIIRGHGQSIKKRAEEMFPDGKYDLLESGKIRPVVTVATSRSDPRTRGHEHKHGTLAKAFSQERP